MKHKLVIFDLDGTLLDTIGDLASAVNYAMRMKGYPEHTLEEYRFFVGNGVRKLIERSLPEDKKGGPMEIEEDLRYFMQYYQDHLSDRTVPYRGIPELLATLSSQGMMMAVASNKYHKATTALVSRLFPDIDFVAVMGQREGVPTKPDPSVVYEIMRIAGVSEEEVLYVGDSGVDMQTAKNAGVESVGVTWGFRPVEELIKNQASHIADLPECIKDFV